MQLERSPVCARRPLQHTPTAHRQASHLPRRSSGASTVGRPPASYARQTSAHHRHLEPPSARRQPRSMVSIEMYPSTPAGRRATCRARIPCLSIPRCVNLLAIGPLASRVQNDAPSSNQRRSSIRGALHHLVARSNLDVLRASQQRRYISFMLWPPSSLRRVGSTSI